MYIAFVISRIFDNTQVFTRAVAGTPGMALSILKGDEAPDAALRRLRMAQRLWFEGAAPLLVALLRRFPEWPLPKACLRVAEDEVMGLPLPDLWRAVSDLIVPTRQAAAAVRHASACAKASADKPAGDPATGAIHVLDEALRREILGQARPGADIDRLGELLLKPAGDLTVQAWESIAVLGETCRGRVLLRGQPPREVAGYLAEACGLDVVGASAVPKGPADSVVFWQNITTRVDAAGRFVACPPTELRDGLALLAPDGVAAIVALIGAGAVEGSTNNLKDLLASALASRGTVQACARGKVAIAEVRPESAARVWPPRATPAVPDICCDSLPRVTAVVPVYNDAGRVGRCLASLRQQTYPHLEILVVDDGSTDGTAHVVAKHLNDPRVRYLYKSHSGRAETRNEGIRQARGTYIAWLGSDDEAMPNRIRLQVEAVRRNPRAGVVHADGFFIRPDGALREHRRYESLATEDLPARLFEGLAAFCPILDTSAMVRRDLYDRIGLYDRAFPRCQDYDFYIRAAMAGDVAFEHVPRTLVKVHESAPSTDRAHTILGFYLILARRLIEFFGEDRLPDPVARDLHEAPCLAVGRTLASMASAFSVPPGHAAWFEARKYLSRAAETASPADRAEAWNLLGSVAEACGDRELAGDYYDRARTGAALVHA